MNDKEKVAFIMGYYLGVLDNMSLTTELTDQIRTNTSILSGILMTRMKMSLTEDITEDIKNFAKQFRIAQGKLMEEIQDEQLR